MATDPKRAGTPARTPAVLRGNPAFKEPVYVTRARAPDAGLFSSHVERVFSSRWFTNNGELLRELERRLTACLDVGFCAAVANGTVGLQIALRSLGIRGEVITTPFTFPATVHAIEWNGLTPVFCDVDAETWNLDPARARELVSERTAALLPVHVFGNPCDTRALGRLAEERGLAVVYDAAHAFGVSHRGRAIGRFGDLSVFSFHATKLFHTGEGGAIVGSDPERLRSVSLLRNFGIVDEDEVRGVGLNGKLSELHAALGLALLDGVRAEIDARGRLAQRYRERLGELDGVRFQRRSRDDVPNHAYFTLEIHEAAFGLSRDQVHFALGAENIVTRKYFAPLCSENASYREHPSARPEALPNAHALAARILCLPLYGELGPDDVDRIVEALVSIRAHAPRVRAAAAAA